MPASLKDLRSRIKSVKGIQQITKAMKLVSAAKFGRAQQAVTQARPYAAALGSLAGRLVAAAAKSDSSSGDAHPLLRDSGSNLALVVVLSSDRSLCGGYNSNVAKQTVRLLDKLEAQGTPYRVLCIGRKAFQVLSRRQKMRSRTNFEPAHLSLNDIESVPEKLVQASTIIQMTTPFDKPNFELATRLAETCEELYEEHRIGTLYLVYTNFVSAMTQEPTTEALLPVQTTSQGKGSGGQAESSDGGVIFEPDVRALLQEVLPRFLAVRIFQALLEATASEHGARMTAMDNSTRNAKEMQRSLEITYQRARQAAITRELIEIISGAEAL